jgi:hypothetical protein
MATNWQKRVAAEIARDEAQITKTLVKMGWCPPEKAKAQATCVSALKNLCEQVGTYQAPLGVSKARIEAELCLEALAECGEK